MTATQAPSAADGALLTVPRSAIQPAYDPFAPVQATVQPGDSITFETWDARTGALLDRPTGTPFELPKPTPGAGNPVTGPVAVAGAQPGDALVVELLAVRCGPVGWCGGHAHVGPVPPGRIPRPIGRTCRIEGDRVHFSEDLVLPLRPMVGCVGLAPAGEAILTAHSGRHGGNMDQQAVTAGARLLLPVAVPGGLVSVGDVHATQGDGELSGVALEVPAEVDVRVDLVPGAAPSWPWLVDERGSTVLAVAPTFEEARSLAVDAALTEVERCLGLEPADALALLSLVADLRVGGAFGGPQVNVRVDLPAHLGVAPVGLSLT